MALSRRGPWSPVEDAELTRLIGQTGAHHWVEISRGLESRSAKQCRERWHNHLNPHLLRTSITPDEGEKILAMVNTMGKRWATIARRLPGRSDNTIKNWWNGNVNRQKRNSMSSGSDFSDSIEQDHQYSMRPIEVYGSLQSRRYLSTRLPPVTDSEGTSPGGEEWEEQRDNRMSLSRLLS